MQVWIRLVRTGLPALRGSGRAPPSHVSNLAMRVGVGDIDVNLHMNNGRAVTVMDLGRIDLLIRTGIWREMRRRRATGVIASQRVRYRAPLAWRDRFRLESRIVGWPEEGVIFEHRVWRQRGGEEVLAVTATARFVFVSRRGPPRGRRRRIAPGEVLRGTAWHEAPALSEEARGWLAAEQLIR